ncbi:MAG: hypothetical protein AB7U82_20025 [Blastocatellales bacterium]
MAENNPTFEEWRRLYAIAGRVKEMAPWDWMMEDEVFGVQNPESDEIGFVSVMGAAGEHFAIALYPTPHALYDFLELQEQGELGLLGDVAPDRILEIPQLQASFENREQLDKEDREVIKKLNLKFRGANNWPQFRSYAPGMFPWFLNSSEARFLTAALEQLLEVAPRLRDNDDILHGEDDEDFLVRVSRKENDHAVWEDKIMRVPEPEKKTPTPAPLAPQQIEALKRLPKTSLAIEMELTMLPMPVREKKERPFFPYLLLIADAQRGLVLGTDMLQPLPSLEAMRAELPLKLAETLSQLGAAPRLITVRTAMTASLLAPLAAELGIQLKQSPELPALDEALNFMMRMNPF